MKDDKVPKPQAAPQNPIKTPAPEKPPVQQPAKAEERKRGGWGANKDADAKKGPQSNSKDPAGRKEKANMMVKKPASNPYESHDNELTSPDNKKKKQDDWNYLK